MTSATPPSDLPTLADLRSQIDELDETMHRLLMQRGEIIDQLIVIKGTVQSGSAFRPEREASMMQALVARHQGLLPLDTVEGIWRVIISTFTHMQAPYTIHCDESVGINLMRDSGRFHFGFTVPYQGYDTTQQVIDAVTHSKGDLGLVPVESKLPWWLSLTYSDAPQVIARLPFVGRPDHPAGLPVFVISKPLSEPVTHEVMLFSLTGDSLEDLLGSVPFGLIASFGKHHLVSSSNSSDRKAFLKHGFYVGGHAKSFNEDGKFL